MLLGINMPRLEGVAVLKLVKADPITAQIPVIMFTTTDDPDEIDRSNRFGCSAYLTNTVAYEQFVEAIKRLGNFLGIVRVPGVKAS